MTKARKERPIVIYLVERHPLDLPETGPVFQWLHTDNDYQRQLEDLLGPYDKERLTMMVDSQPAGPAWREMLEGLLDESIDKVVTHLAPLSSAQRQQLIGVCAQTGTQLVTPGDAGRSRYQQVFNSTR